MPDQCIDLAQGTIDFRQTSSDLQRIRQDSLYPTLHRLERPDRVKARGTSGNNRRALARVLGSA